MTDTQRADRFRFAWSRPGGMHWVYDTMADSLATWKKWGIDTLPDWTQGAADLLAPDVARDEAWHVELRAKSGGA